MNSLQKNDLFDYDYSIYQNDKYFKFSIDSVLLAEFVRLRKGKTKVLDLCSGNAPIPMILDKKYNNLSIIGVELQKEIYEMAVASIECNKISSIRMINDDVNNINKIFDGEKFDVVTCNPPYFKVRDNALVNSNKIKAIARHEIKLDLESFVINVKKVIQNQGYFYMVHHVSRFTDVIDILHKYNFGIKRMVFVHDNNKLSANLFLVEAMFNGKDNIEILPPVFVKETKTYKNIFEG